MTDNSVPLVRGGVEVPQSRLRAFKVSLSDHVKRECHPIEVHCCNCEVKTEFPNSELPPHKFIVGKERTEAPVNPSLLPSTRAKYKWISNEALSVRSVYGT